MITRLKNEFEKKLVIPITSAFIEELDAVVKEVVSILDVQIVEELSNVIVLNEPSEAIYNLVNTKYNDLYDKDLHLCNIGYVWISAVVLYEAIIGESASSFSDKKKSLYALALRNAIVEQHNSLEHIAFPKLVEEIISHWSSQSFKLQVSMTNYYALQDDILDGRASTVNYQDSAVLSALQCLAIKAAYADFADFAGSKEIDSIENLFVRIFVLAYNMVESYYWPLQSEKIAKIIKRYIPNERRWLKNSDIDVLRSYVKLNDIKLTASVGKTSWLLRMIYGDCDEYTSQLRMDAYTFGVYVYYELIFEKLKNKAV